MTGARGIIVAAIWFLALGFLATAIGSIWSILSPAGGGVNFAAAALYNGGMLVGLIGLALGITSLVVIRRTPS